MTVEFEAWPKIPRYNRGITITEKIDGTNAAVVIVELDKALGWEDDENRIKVVEFSDAAYGVYAQSRTRFIIPGRDNYGFAAWVEKNATNLVAVLGAGRHFGEWWGQGIQRRYEQDQKHFSLFNAKRWETEDLSAVPELSTVPVIYTGQMRQEAIDAAMYSLRESGSFAAPGYPSPEGIVVFHHASRTSFKVTLEGDEAPKGELAHANDEEKN